MFEKLVVGAGAFQLGDVVGTASELRGDGLAEEATDEVVDAQLGAVVGAAVVGDNW